MHVAISRQLKMHGELIAAGICGLLIAVAYFLPSTSVPLLIAAFAIGGFAKAKEGITDLVENRTLNIEILMIAAAIGAGIIGHWAEGALLIFIFSLSGALETYTMNRSERDLSRLIQLQPDHATRVQDGTYETVPVSALNVGDHVLVKPGERVPIDGVVVQGASEVDEAPITGESIPVWKSEGDEARAGTLNGSGSIVLEVTRQAHDTLFQKIVRLVRKRAKTQRRRTGSSNDLRSRTSKLCWSPWRSCLSRLLSFSDGVGTKRGTARSSCSSSLHLARWSLPYHRRCFPHSPAAREPDCSVKGGSHMEQLASIRVVAMDKTGTITSGEPQVTDIFIRPGADEAAILSHVAGIERHSAHPLARAIVRFAELRNIDDAAFANVENAPGQGIAGTAAGIVWRVGSAEFVGRKKRRRFCKTSALRRR